METQPSAHILRFVVRNDSLFPVLGMFPRLAVSDGNGDYRDVEYGSADAITVEFADRMMRLPAQASHEFRIRVLDPDVPPGTKLMWALDYVDYNHVLWRREFQRRPIPIRGREITPMGKRAWDMVRKQFSDQPKAKRSRRLLLGNWLAARGIGTFRQPKP